MTGSLPTSTAAPLWSTDRRHGALAAILAVLVFGLGLVLGRWHEIGGYMVENDYYGQYLPAAHAILRGEPMANPRSGPGYPLLLAAGGFFTDDLFAYAKVLAALSLAAAGYFTFLAVRAFTSAGAALIAQLFVYAVLGRFCVVVGNDLPFVALAAVSLYFLLRRQDPGALGLSLSGLFAGLAMSLRYPGVALIPVAVVALWLWPIPATGVRQRLTASLLFALPAVLGSAPSWAAHPLGLSTGKESKAYAFVALDVYADPQDRLSQTHLDEMEVRFQSMWDVLTRDPKRVVAHYATDFFDDAMHIAQDSVTLPAILFVGAGLLLWFLVGTADRRRAAAFLVFPLVTFGIVALVPYQARYGFPLAPAAAALLGATFAQPWTEAVANPGAAAPPRVGRLQRALLLLCFLPPIAMTAVKLREYLTTEPLELVEAAETLRALAKPGDRVIARKAHLPALAGAVHVFPRQNCEWDEFLAWARHEAHARFLLVGEWEGRTNGALRPLIDGDAPAGLALRWRHAAPPQSLYELLPE